jgi:hypothetical protein
VSDEQAEDQTDEPSEALTGEVHELAQRPNGGALAKGGSVRPKQPTLEESSALARKRMYQLIPEMTRIAKGRVRKGSKKRIRPMEQIAAIRELRQIAQDKTLRESVVNARLAATTSEIIDHLGRDAALPLLQKLAPIWIEG